MSIPTPPEGANLLFVNFCYNVHKFWVPFVEEDVLRVIAKDFVESKHNFDHFIKPENHLEYSERTNYDKYLQVSDDTLEVMENAPEGVYPEDFIKAVNTVRTEKEYRDFTKVLKNKYAPLFDAKNAPTESLRAFLSGTNKEELTIQRVLALRDENGESLLLSFVTELNAREKDYSSIFSYLTLPENVYGAETVYSYGWWRAAKTFSKDLNEDFLRVCAEGVFNRMQTSRRKQEIEESLVDNQTVKEKAMKKYIDSFDAKQLELIIAINDMNSSMAVSQARQTVQNSEYNENLRKEHPKLNDYERFFLLKTVDEFMAPERRELLMDLLLDRTDEAQRVTKHSGISGIESF